MSAPGRYVVGAAGSGHGKTLVSLALCKALRDAGVRVQPYKIGPDFIDARFYARVAGRPAYNLDLWLDGEAGVRAHVAATRGDAEIVLCEGMMGLYDGANDGTGTTADVARALDASVIVVLDCWSASQTAAAVALGLRRYDPRLSFAGAILNRVAGDAHERAVRDACARAGIVVLAAVRNDPAYEAAERGLGLDPAAVERRAAAVDALARALGATPALAALFGFAAPRTAPPRAATPLAELAATPLAEPAATLRIERGATLPNPVPALASGARPRIAYASDDAFWFTYAETLDALRAAGAELVPFSPLHDTALPPQTCGVWIGGGYPEHYAAALEANTAMRVALAAAFAAGMPGYAECGGMMYLAQSLDTGAGSFAMVGAFAGSTSMAVPALRIGYRDARVLVDTPLDAAGTAIKGYEFHYATASLRNASPAYAIGDATDGVVARRLVAGFLHRHFLPGDPAVARFVAACAAHAPVRPHA